MKKSTLLPLESDPRRLGTPTDLDHNAVKGVAGAMNAILADVFALYIKTKNFHRTSATTICCSTSRPSSYSP